MHITITGVHIEITEAIKSYTEEKVSNLEKYIGNRNTKVDVFLSKTTEHHNHGDIFKAEANMHIDGKALSAKTTEDDLYKAIDGLKDILARELTHHKDKKISVFRRGAHKIKNLLKRGN